MDEVFDKKQLDMANEPDIAYPYLYNYAKGFEWKTQQRITNLINEYFTNKPAGLPSNDDTGTMSAWLIYSMMGIYPVSPAEPLYTITSTRFDKITIHLDTRYYKNKTLIIEKNGKGKLDSFTINGKTKKSFFISHEMLTNASVIKFNLKKITKSSFNCNKTDLISTKKQSVLILKTFIYYIILSK